MSFHSPIRATRPLSDDELRRYAPAIFAEAPHESRSDRYAYTPTTAIIQAMRDHDFLPVWASAARVRDRDRNGYQKHLIRFRARGEFDTRLPEMGEIVLKGSHDGSSSEEIRAGIFRLVCENGLIVGEEWARVRVRHTGNALAEILAAAHEVTGKMGTARERIAHWKTIELTRNEQGAFGEAAARLRWPTAEYPDLPIQVGEMIQARRSADTAPDLWTTMNRAQESLIRGGIRTRTRTTDGRIRRGTAREVTGIDNMVGLNSALWTLAERMAELKGA